METTNHCSCSIIMYFMLAITITQAIGNFVKYLTAFESNLNDIYCYKLKFCYKVICVTLL